MSSSLEFFPFDPEPTPIDLVKQCHHGIEDTLWDMAVDAGQVYFICATDSRPMHEGMLEWASDLLYTPDDKPGERYSSIRVRLGPVDMDNGTMEESPEPNGIPIHPTRWCARCAGLEDGPCEVPHHINW